MYCNEAILHYNYKVCMLSVVHFEVKFTFWTQDSASSPQEDTHQEDVWDFLESKQQVNSQPQLLSGGIRLGVP